VCGICGRIWTEEKPGPPFGEEIVGFSLYNYWEEDSFSGLSNVHCLLVFTTQRLAVLRGSSQMRQNIPNYRRIDPYMLRLLEERGLDEILAEGIGNFSIPYADIVKVELGMRWLNPRMNIVTRDGLFRFTWFWPWAASGRVERIMRARFPIEVAVEKVKGI